MKRIAAIIPALNEGASIGEVVHGVRRAGIDHVIVVDNGSSDNTSASARTAGARVISEPTRGYGAACAAGILALPEACEIVVFLDGDGSDDPSELPRLVERIVSGSVDLVIGTRTQGTAERGSLTLPQRLGNSLATRLLCAWHGVRFTDLGPMRAIRRGALERIGMRDRGFGWTVEMQARAAALGLATGEVPVRYRRRAGGRSKISGTLSGSLRAGATILWTLLALRLER
ncbi:MAG: glycosyltransferase [Deltaproteobacteria bacterium]|nr:glycosyltransferase [Deltaproteobacteria bacterium]